MTLKKPPRFRGLFCLFLLEYVFKGSTNQMEYIG